MRHRDKVKKLSLKKAHRRSLLVNLVKDLILHGKVDTTLAKAKEGARLAEKIITVAKGGDSDSRREAFRFLQDKEVVKKLFAEVVPKYQDKSGGYTRVLKLPPRQGDGAARARLTLV